MYCTFFAFRRLLSCALERFALAPSLTSEETEAEKWEALPFAGPRHLLKGSREPRPRGLRSQARLNPWAWGARDLLPSLPAAGGSLGEELGTQRRSQISPRSRDAILWDKRQSPGGTPSARRAEISGSSLMEDKQILCVGLVVLDIINVVDKYPEEDTDSR